MTEMLNSKDMQTLLQVDRSTIYRMAEAGRLPAIKVGKQWRFPRDQVDNWLQTQSMPSASPPQPRPEPPANGLASLLPLDCVQLIQDTFADSLGIMLVITDMDGNPITEVSHPCGLFAAVSKEPNAIQKCVDDWHNMATDIDLVPKLASSHLGLLCTRGLIRVGPELKGMVFLGGIAPENWPPTSAQVQAMAVEFGVEPEALIAHINEVFYLDDVEQARVLSFVQRIANIIAHIVNERHDFISKLDAIAQLTR